MSFLIVIIDVLGVCDSSVELNFTNAAFDLVGDGHPALISVIGARVWITTIWAEVGDSARFCAFAAVAFLTLHTLSHWQVVVFDHRDKSFVALLAWVSLIEIALLFCTEDTYPQTSIAVTTIGVVASFAGIDSCVAGDLPVARDTFGS